MRVTRSVRPDLITAHAIDHFGSAPKCRKSVSGERSLPHVLQNELPDLGAPGKGRVREDQIQQFADRLRIDRADRENVEGRDAESAIAMPMTGRRTRRMIAETISTSGSAAIEVFECVNKRNSKAR